MTTDVLIRRAAIGDSGPIAGLMTELGYPTTASAMTKRLSGIFDDPSPRVTFVAESEGEVVGVAGARAAQYYEKDDFIAHLVIIVVAAKAQRLGVGRRLVSAVEAWASDQGANEVLVTSGIPREGAHRFYEECGFSRNGFRFVRRLHNAN